MQPRQQVNDSEPLGSITALCNKHFLQSEHCWELLKGKLTCNILPEKHISYWASTIFQKTHF